MAIPRLVVVTEREGAEGNMLVVALTSRVMAAIQPILVSAWSQRIKDLAIILKEGAEAMVVMAMEVGEILQVVEAGGVIMVRPSATIVVPAIHIMAKPMTA